MEFVAFGVLCKRVGHLLNETLGGIGSPKDREEPGSDFIVRNTKR
jgi:hypothetical protein